MVLQSNERFSFSTMSFLQLPESWTCVYTHNFMEIVLYCWIDSTTRKACSRALKACKLKLSILSSMVLIRLLRYWPWNKTNESLNQTQFNKLELRPKGNPKLWKRSLNPNWSSTTDSGPMMTLNPQSFCSPNSYPKAKPK